VKRSILVEADGGPIAVVIAGANVPDAQLLEKTIEAVVLERPPVEDAWPQHLCLDKGYDNETGWGTCIDHEYEPHIALIRDERPAAPKLNRPRRWVVERTLAWLSKCRAILVRWDKNAENYLGLIKLACTLLWFRRYRRLSHREAGAFGSQHG
jgi:putative transposase